MALCKGIICRLVLLSSCWSAMFVILLAVSGDGVLVYIWPFGYERWIRLPVRPLLNTMCTICTAVVM